MRIQTQYLILLIVCFCTFFVNLGLSFPDLMECRNFITAREMVQEGNWWYTTMNLEPRLEKPPLPTWLTAITAIVYGGFDNLFILRLPSALISTLMVYFFFQLCKELTNEKYFPFIGALVLATSLLVMQQARTNSWDIFPHAFMVGSIWQLLKGLNQNKWSSIYWATFWLICSVLSKGPVSVYALWLPFIVAFSMSGKWLLIKQNWSKMLFLVFVGLAIGFSWRIATTLNDPMVSEMVIGKEMNSWAGRHVRPFYFYMHFPLYVGIWMPFLVASFFYKYFKPRINRYGNYQFMIGWIILSILLLSVVPTKKERYLFPALIPMCLMVAYVLYSFYRDYLEKKVGKVERGIVNSFGWLLFSASILFPIGLLLQNKVEVQMITLVSSLVIGCIGIAGLLSLKSARFKNMFGLTIAMVCSICIGIVPQGLDVFYNHPDFNSLGNAKEIPLVKENTVYVMSEEVDPRIVWLIGKPTQLLTFDKMKDSTNYPFVVVSFEDPSSVISEKMGTVKKSHLGTYDVFRKKVKWRTEVNFYSLE